VGDARGFRVDFGGAFFGVKYVKYNSRIRGAERENGGCGEVIILNTYLNTKWITLEHVGNLGMYNVGEVGRKAGLRSRNAADPLFLAACEQAKLGARSGRSQLGLRGIAGQGIHREPLSCRRLAPMLHLYNF
jgi:hypothetical protein